MITKLRRRFHTFQEMLIKTIKNNPFERKLRSKFGEKIVLGEGKNPVLLFRF